jgi:hypothetical protein
MHVGNTTMYVRRGISGALEYYREHDLPTHVTAVSGWMVQWWLQGGADGREGTPASFTVRPKRVPTYRGDRAEDPKMGTARPGRPLGKTRRVMQPNAVHHRTVSEGEEEKWWLFWVQADGNLGRPDGGPTVRVVVKDKDEKYVWVEDAWLEGSPTSGNYTYAKRKHNRHNFVTSHEHGIAWRTGGYVGVPDAPPPAFHNEDKPVMVTKDAEGRRVVIYAHDGEINARWRERARYPDTHCTRFAQRQTTGVCALISVYNVVVCNSLLRAFCTKLCASYFRTVGVRGEEAWADTHVSPPSDTLAATFLRIFYRRVHLGGSEKSQGFVDWFVKSFEKLPRRAHFKPGDVGPTLHSVITVFESLGLGHVGFLTNPLQFTNTTCQYVLTQRAWSIGDHGAVSLVGSDVLETPPRTVLVGAVIGIPGHNIAGIYCHRKATTFDSELGQLPLTHDWKTSSTSHYAAELYAFYRGDNGFVHVPEKCTITILCIFVSEEVARNAKDQDFQPVLPEAVVAMYLREAKFKGIHLAISNAIALSLNIVIDIKRGLTISVAHSTT